jgi:hypothetical protein
MRHVGLRGSRSAAGSARGRHLPLTFLACALSGALSACATESPRPETSLWQFGAAGFGPAAAPYGSTAQSVPPLITSGDGADETAGWRTNVIPEGDYAYRGGRIQRPE